MATYLIGSDPGDDYASWTAFHAAVPSPAAGSIISFRKGDTFREQVTVAASGSDGSPITYTSHGDGTTLSNILRTPVKNANNPLIASDYTFRWILKVGSTYWEFKEKKTGSIWSVHYRTSSDGYAWSSESASLMSAGGAGAFDEYGQADPTVIYDGTGDWKMWYDAQKSDSTWYSLGYSTSADGITWSKYGAVLDVGAEGAWDDSFVHHPCVIKEGSTYYLYYSGHDGGGIYHIGLATSADGISWTKYGSTPVISAGAGGTFDDAYVRPAKPIIIGSTWYMTYWGYDGAISRLGLATSTDGYTWTKRGQFMDVGGGGSWDASEVQANCGLVEGDVLKIWYTGKNAVGTYGTGLATVDISTYDHAVINGSDLVQGWTATPLLDIGDTGGDRLSVTRVNTTYINLSNPCDFTGTVNQIKLYLKYDTAGKVMKVGVFYNTSGANYTCRSVVSLTVSGTAGALVTLTAPTDFTEFSTQAGDYLGVFTSDGGAVIQRSNDDPSLGIRFIAGDATDGGSYNFGSSIATECLALYASGVVPNVWQAALTTEPTQVFFNGTKGELQASAVACTGTGHWYWAANVLYVYSTTDADTAYVSPGIEASVRDYCIDTNSQDYTITQNLKFTRANSVNVLLDGANQAELNYCISTDSVDGVEMDTAASKVQNCVIYNCTNGIDVDAAGYVKNTIIRNCTDDLEETGGTAQKTTNNIEDDSDADPLMTDPGSGDFTLQIGSPCINRGAHVGLYLDYLGLPVPIGHRPDIGAYEHKNGSNAIW